MGYVRVQIKHSVAVLALLEGTSLGNVDVVSLFGGEWGELGTKSGQVISSHLLVQFLGKNVDLSLGVLVVILVCPELELSEHLVSERA